MNKRICVVGAGRWGSRHVATLEALGLLAGVVERDDARRLAIQATYPNVATYACLEDALEEEFDGFTIATPAETHADLAERIIRRRKAVLVEKPLALTAADARRLQARAGECGVGLMVGHLMLFHPAIRKIKEMVTAGAIGKPQYMYSNRLNLGTVRAEENILWSFAPHDISIFQYIMETKPEQVLSRGGTFLRPGIHDTTMTILNYPNNVVGHIFVSWLHPFKEHRLVVIGSKGMLSYEDSSRNKELLFYEKGIDLIRGEPITREGATAAVPYDRHMPLTEELRYFAEHLADGEFEIAGAGSAVEVLEILESAGGSLLSPEPQAAPAARSAESWFAHDSACIDEHVRIGRGTRIWHFSHVQSGSEIGRECTLGQNVFVGPNVTIGNHVKIQNNVSIYEGVELEDHVFCGPSMVFTNVRDPRSKYPQRGGEHYRRTLVREGASIGANATIVCGHTIGRHAFVAAGAVVTSDVADYALVAGVPARPKGWVCECGQRLPPFDQRVTCPRCELRYVLSESKLAALESGNRETVGAPAAWT